MAGVSVTIESLNTVKRAFSDFQTDIESFSNRVHASSEQILVEVKQSLKKQEGIVVALENKVFALANEIEQIQSAIISINARIVSLKTEITNLEKERSQLESCISQLEQQKRQLETQRNQCQDDTSGIDAQIRALENQIHSCRGRMQQCNEQISFANRQLTENERKCAELKATKIKKEDELSSAKAELNRARSKLERLNDAGDTVEREITNLNMATQKFERSSTATNAASKSGVDKCIALIEEYISVNLAGAGLGSVYSNHTQPTMTNISAETPGNADSEPFCRGISINRDPTNDSRFFVSGNHIDGFLSYWQNMDQYTETPNDSSDNIVFIRARDIEGIHLSEDEVADPIGFWGRRTGGTQETFEGISSQIPEVRSLYENGNSLQAIREMRPGLSDCIGIYFEGAPSVSALENYYVFNSNGRHRILAAYAADEIIPVRVSGSIHRRE